jgi:glycosyltransferase involved in cell wall biosynthesis
MSKKIFIVIPTKDRAQTLYFSIQTALSQDYDNFEVLVSDNNSSADIQALVTSFKDDRLKYQRSERSLSMVNSWEFALSAVTGSGLVHFMGDDNGLVPGSLRRVSELHEITGSKIIHSDVIDYVWPDQVTGDCMIKVPLSTGFYNISSSKALKGAFSQLFGFNWLPTINVAFVDTDVIAKAKKYGDGKYFLASNPDVYSAFINAFVEDHFVYSNYPFIINGASKYSNGASAQKSQGVSQFIDDNLRDNYTYHCLFPASTSYYLNVYEALAIMCDATNYKNFKDNFNFKKLLKKIIDQEYVLMNRFWLKQDIAKFASLNNLIFTDYSLPDIGESKVVRTINNSNFKFTTDNSFVIGNMPGVMNNVADAAILSGQILSGDIKLSKFYNLKYYLKHMVRKIIL